MTLGVLSAQFDSDGLSILGFLRYLLPATPEMVPGRYTDVSLAHSIGTRL